MFFGFGAGGGGMTVSAPQSGHLSLPPTSSSWHGMKFIAGEPMKLATKRVAGLW